MDEIQVNSHFWVWDSFPVSLNVATQLATEASKVANVLAIFKKKKKKIQSRALHGGGKKDVES